MGENEGEKVKERARGQLVIVKTLALVLSWIDILKGEETLSYVHVNGITLAAVWRRESIELFR